MWRDYLSGYLKNNRGSGASVRAAAFISALLLSLLCGLSYNLWKYEVERIVLEEGGWQSRIMGELAAEDLEIIKNFAHVEKAVVSSMEAETAGDMENSRGAGTSADIQTDLYFDHMGNVLRETPKIAARLEIPPERISYHHTLLAMYLVRDPLDPAPRLVFPLFLMITALASFSLIVIIHNSFAVSMNARIRQFGIFSSIGATPRQIRACLLREAGILCALPAAAGGLLGILAAMVLVWMSNVLLGEGIPGRHESVFGYHPLVLAATAAVTVLTIWISAWIPAGKLSRLTPLEAIRNTGELRLKRGKRFPLLAVLFGVRGELAGSALKAQKRALRTSSLSLVISFLAFTLMQCFFTLSGISTRETYFERYQDVWDIMVTVKNGQIGAFEETDDIRELSGVTDVIAYQKAAAGRIVTEDEISSGMKEFGGFDPAPSGDAVKTGDGWLVNAPVVVMDDAGFLEYCEAIGAAPRLDGAVIRNCIEDVTNPDFCHPVYVPYVKGEKGTTVLRQAGNAEITAELPVLAYTDQVPRLREEYASLDHYEMVHFLPASLWEKIRERIGGEESNLYVRVLCGENASEAELSDLQNEIGRLLSPRYAAESENRIQKKELNDRQIMGMMTVLGTFCVLLAVIGISNVFSNALGFVRQRKREFARYMSVGLTPGEIRDMLCIEALAIAGRPVLITLPAAAVVTWYLIRMSYMEPSVFLAEAPWAPILAFMLGIFGSVALAYYLGWRGIRGISLAEVLRDDTMM